MYQTSAAATLIVERSTAAAMSGQGALHEALDDLPAAIYVTDADGLVTYFNTACIAFSGRMPEVRRDRWCVSWKLRTLAGEPLPHDACPMAVAVKSGRPVRGMRAVAERPDGTRVTFQPHPTPLFDDEGRIRGAVNILIDVTDEMQASLLRQQAQKCRRLSMSVGDLQASETLDAMAAEYDAKARQLGQGSPPAS